MPERIKVVNHLHRGARSFFQRSRFTIVRLTPAFYVFFSQFYAETLEFRRQLTATIEIYTVKLELLRRVFTANREMNVRREALFFEFRLAIR